jgi:hypothetical protein
VSLINVYAWFEQQRQQQRELERILRGPAELLESLARASAPPLPDVLIPPAAAGSRPAPAFIRPDCTCPQGEPVCLSDCPN